MDGVAGVADVTGVVMAVMMAVLITAGGVEDAVVSEDAVGVERDGLSELGVVVRRWGFEGEGHEEGDDEQESQDAAKESIATPLAAGRGVHVSRRW
jgi:hypothetical protein